MTQKELSYAREWLTNWCDRMSVLDMGDIEDFISAMQEHFPDTEIQMPSGAEILNAAEEHVEACDEDGCPYADVEDAKVAFGNGVVWLKSKCIR